MDLVLCRSLIIILGLGVLCDQCYLINLIKIFTSTQIQDKDFVYVHFFHFIMFRNQAATAEMSNILTMP